MVVSSALKGRLNSYLYRIKHSENEKYVSGNAIPVLCKKLKRRYFGNFRGRSVFNQSMESSRQELLRYVTKHTTILKKYPNYALPPFNLTPADIKLFETRVTFLL